VVGSPITTALSYKALLPRLPPPSPRLTPPHTRPPPNLFCTFPRCRYFALYFLAGFPPQVFLFFCFFFVFFPIRPNLPPIVLRFSFSLDQPSQMTNENIEIRLPAGQSRNWLPAPPPTRLPIIVEHLVIEKPPSQRRTFAICSACFFLAFGIPEALLHYMIYFDLASCGPWLE